MGSKPLRTIIKQNRKKIHKTKKHKKIMINLKYKMKQEKQNKSRELSEWWEQNYGSAKLLVIYDMAPFSGTQGRIPQSSPTLLLWTLLTLTMVCSICGPRQHLETADYSWFKVNLKCIEPPLTTHPVRLRRRRRRGTDWRLWWRHRWGRLSSSEDR